MKHGTNFSFCRFQRSVCLCVATAIVSPGNVEVGKGEVGTFLSLDRTAVTLHVLGSAACTLGARGSALSGKGCGLR